MLNNSCGSREGLQIVHASTTTLLCHKEVVSLYTAVLNEPFQVGFFLESSFCHRDIGTYFGINVLQLCSQFIEL